MKGQNKVGLLLLAFVVTARAHSQETASKASIFVLPSKVQDPEAARAHCRSDVTCFDAGAYVVTVTDIIEGDIPNYRRARLVLRFDNLTHDTLILAYRFHSSFMVDNSKSLYSCCQIDSSKEDTSAIGIGIDRDDKVNPQFRLKPQASDNVSFELWRHRPPDEPAAYYHFDVMIDEIDPTGKTILRHPVLFFRNLPAIAPEADQKK
jgi:hypothetical protein